MRRALVFAVAGALLALSGPGAVLAQPPSQSARAEARLPTQDLRAYLPKPVGGWKADGVFDEAEVFDPARRADQDYSRRQGEDGGVSLTITRGLSAGGGPRRLGPDPEVGGRVTSEVMVSGFRGYLVFEAENRTGRLEVRVGRCVVIVDGHDVDAEELVAFARAVDTARLAQA